MRALSTLLALALAAALQPAMAGTVTLNFEDLSFPANPLGGLQSQVALGAQYSAPYGIDFGGDAWGIRSGLKGCGGRYSVDQLSGCNSLMLTGDPEVSPTGSRLLTISVAAGFVDQFVFDYVALLASDGVISVWGDLSDANPLATFDVSASTQPNGCGAVGDDVAICGWSVLNVLKFSGIAHAITISGTDQNLLLDNLQLTTQAGTQPLPEPGGVALALGALGALAWTRRRQAR